MNNFNPLIFIIILHHVHQVQHIALGLYALELRSLHIKWRFITNKYYTTITKSNNMMFSHDSKLSHLRRLMLENGVGAYYIPGEDAHQSEYIAPCDARRAFISGFTGSSGSVIVTSEKAALWTDGRYFLQAEKQLDPKEWTLMKAGLPDVPTRDQWITDQLTEGSAVGVDPTLIPFELMKKWQSTFGKRNISWKPINTNLIDQIWGSDRPVRSTNPVIPLSLKFSGASFRDKLAKLREKMPQNCDGLIVSCLDEIAWVLNLRGQDIPFNPVFFAYMWIQKVPVTQGVILYIDKQLPQQPDDPKDLIIKPYNSIFADLKNWHMDQEKKIDQSSSLLYMSPSASLALVQAAGGPSRVHLLSHSGIISIQKAIKNHVEMEGFRQCHIRDGAALVQFFAWLEDALIKSSNNADGTLTEAGVAQVLSKYREQQKYFMGLSFDTISSVGPNAAIIHYKPEKGTDALLNSSMIYLCDSGAQYQDGTTDVTRTIHFGQPSQKEKSCYTLVLKGHISLGRSVFPMGTSGMKLDILARQYLWQYGLDYRHGTGHGVGHFLNVHEGPHGISGRLEYNEVNLVEGMTVTNEPGYYEDGQFGIRIENVMLVRKKNMSSTFGNVEYFEFETVTMAPMCRALIQVDLLCEEELLWLDCYHERVFGNLKPLLANDPRAQSWLERETRPFLRK